MNDILSEKIVITRKPHNCFACGRKFEIGTKMNRQVNTHEGICTTYTCETCQKLLGNYSEYFIDDAENVYHENCVIELLRYYEYEEMTPEDLLKNLISYEKDIVNHPNCN